MPGSTIGAIKDSHRKQAADGKALPPAAKKQNPNVPATIGEDEQVQILKRKVAELERQLNSATATGKVMYILESPVLYDEEMQMRLAKDPKRRRGFDSGFYVQVQKQPMIVWDTKEKKLRSKMIQGGAVEMIKGRGIIKNPDWVEYLGRNYPDYIIWKQQPNGERERITFAQPKETATRPQGEYFFDELEVTPLMEVAQKGIAPTPVPVMPAREQAKLPEHLRERLANEPIDGPSAIVTAV